ncbi:hypothetical protein QYE76_021327 [Lolium multiflorum]|uniref:Arabidopsis retrotransposon Orf1 C-terminal domain-containing protein n=1 Tax=Lolium multiflorum TaxID=4521 RepID=A0AAD8R6I9_LOLMU|nr:hypothetical protein QYE76_021327 [Lolium multiflorum]
MGKPRDTKIAILPSTTRKGTTLSTSAALDSPSVISKLVSPPQASNAGTYAESENSSYNCDDASAVLDNDGSLGSFLDATIARSRQIENTETPNENAATPVNSPESVEYSRAVIDCNKGKVTFNVDDKEHTVYFPKRIDKDFEFHRSQTNPMVRYKIYNKTINLPFSDFCAAIRVPQWGSCEKVRGTPRELSNLYTMICNGRSFSDDGGKISSIQQPAIRYFAYFVTKKGWSITENELNAYIEREGHHARDGTEEAEEHLDSSSDAASSSYQHYGHVEPPRHSSAQGPYYHSMYDPPAWNPDPRWE